MLKRMLISLSFLFLLIPNIVLAASIEKISSSLGDNEVKIGNSTHLYLDFDIDYSDETEFTGLYMIMIRLNYKDDDIIVTDISSQGFTSVLMLDEETKDKYIVSIVNTGSACFGGLFHCGDYHLDISMFIKDSKNKSTDIVIKDIFLASTSYDSVKETYDENNVSLSEYNYNKKLTLNIKDGVVNVIPTTIATSKTNIDKKNPIKAISTTKKAVTKKATTKNTTSTAKEEISSTKDENPESIKKNDIVANVIEDSKGIIDNLKEKDLQKKIIKYVLIALGIIILIVILVKLKNHKLNKKFKDF